VQFGGKIVILIRLECRKRVEGNNPKINEGKVGLKWKDEELMTFGMNIGKL
jgi:hypothetical protein